MHTSVNNDDIDVLIVEDEPLLQDVYKTILSSNGYKVSVASNGIKAFDELRKKEPAVMLLDYFMPQMDGRTFMMNFNRQVYKAVKIIVISNIADEKALKEMLSLGANKYVLKSDISPKDLVQLVETSSGE